MTAYLLRCGAEDVSVTPRKGAFRLGWTHAGQAMSIPLSFPGQDPTLQIQVACQAIRRRYAAAGVEVGA